MKPLYDVAPADHHVRSPEARCEWGFRSIHRCLRTAVVASGHRWPPLLLSQTSVQSVNVGILRRLTFDLYVHAYSWLLSRWGVWQILCCLACVLGDLSLNWTSFSLFFNIHNTFLFFSRRLLPASQSANRRCRHMLSSSVLGLVTAEEKLVACGKICFICGYCNERV